jgi:hypothetical protein
MIIYPIIRWSGCDFCLGYDEEIKSLTARKFCLSLGKNQKISGYYQFFLWGPAWIFLIRDERYYFVNRKTGHEIWLGDDGIIFEERKKRFLTEYIVAYKDEWQLHSYSFSRFDVSQLDPGWDRLDQTTEDIVLWALDAQSAQRRASGR